MSTPPPPPPPPPVVVLLPEEEEEEEEEEERSERAKRLSPTRSQEAREGSYTRVRREEGEVGRGPGCGGWVGG